MVPADELLCYICMEGGAVPSRCMCTDRHVHDTCLVDWLRRKSSTQCDVCLAHIENVTVKVTRRRIPSAPCWGVAMASVCSLTLGVVVRY